MSVLGQVVWRTVLIYFVVLVMMRLMGKREIAQLSPFDFAVAIMIAEVAVLPMESLEIPLFRGLLPLLILTVLEIGFSYLSLHSRWLRRLVYGEPQLVIWEGKVLHREMRRARYNLDDLLAQLREKGYHDPSEVACAVLESSGRLSVIPRSEYRPLTRGDLGLPPVPVGPVRVLVADGEILEENLKVVGVDREWLLRELEKQGFREPEKVFLATLSPQGKLFVSPKEEEEGELPN
ncbi:protein of unknown function DUF421 [Ammonifex degensii KC4]|uniref:YetF C-terminal domain-containing protein n=1 Tax=Ammonifex degensii (strain DSM 10501 / KC4) TaxID=429009 RepID=C9R8F2_AMMDK|nr:DUF421 domain-containing protein [Ammonifex degensii]ACX52581.1 protein of unknown function DUF421 [Ammonifex degensii KC4]